MTDPEAGTASTDMGDVSHELPAIHPWLAICDRDETALHERRFAEHAASERGLATMLIAAKAMARTTADLLSRPELLARAAERSAMSDQSAERLAGVTRRRAGRYRTG